MSQHVDRYTEMKIVNTMYQNTDKENNSTTQGGENTNDNLSVGSGKLNKSVNSEDKNDKSSQNVASVESKNESVKPNIPNTEDQTSNINPMNFGNMHPQTQQPIQPTISTQPNPPFMMPMSGMMNPMMKMNPTGMTGMNPSAMPGMNPNAMTGMNPNMPMMGVMNMGNMPMRGNIRGMGMPGPIPPNMMSMMGNKGMMPPNMPMPNPMQPFNNTGQNNNNNIPQNLSNIENNMHKQHSFNSGNTNNPQPIPGYPPNLLGNNQFNPIQANDQMKNQQFQPNQAINSQNQNNISKEPESKPDDSNMKEDVKKLLMLLQKKSNPGNDQPDYTQQSRDPRDPRNRKKNA